MTDEGRDAPRGDHQDGPGPPTRSVLQGGLHSSEDDPNNPACAESSGEEGGGGPLRRKRRGEQSGSQGTTKRRQILEISSDSEDGAELDLDIVDLCNTSDEEDSDADSSDDDCHAKVSASRDAIPNGTHDSAVGSQQSAVVGKFAPKGMGELTIPPFRGRAEEMRREANRGAGAELVIPPSRNGSAGARAGLVIPPFRSGAGEASRGAGAGKRSGGGRGGQAYSVVNLAGDSSDSGDDCDSDGGKNAIPFTRSAAQAPASSLSRNTSSAVNLAKGSSDNYGDRIRGEGFIPLTRSAAQAPAWYDTSQQKQQKSSLSTQQQKQRKPSLSARLWPSASRFYRAALRWVYCPKDCSIEEDAQSAQRMANLVPVPTEFASLLDYQKTMSQLVLKEAVAGLQQESATKSRGNVLMVRGEVETANLLDVGGEKRAGKKSKGGQPSSASAPLPPPSVSSSDGKLYSLRVKLILPTVPAYGNGKDYVPASPFRGQELVSLTSPRWRASSNALLGVVQAWDPVYDKLSRKPSTKKVVVKIRILVCVSSTGGDGVGGRGGWLPLKDIQECLGNDNCGVPVTISSAGSLVTACREFQAVMSLPELPERVHEFLLDPSKAPTTLLPRFVVTNHLPVSSSRGGREAGGGARENGSSARQNGDVSPPSSVYTPPPPPGPCSVPPKLWMSLIQKFNSSQVQAMRKVVDGSPSGFTLLQGPPGTGKTRTIMGIVGVLLAGACPFPSDHNSEGGEGGASGSGAKVPIGSSISGKGKGKKGKQKGKQKAARIVSPLEKASPRILIVAPSNAAVDELVLRLCQEGVPGVDGRVRFPRVVRVGGPRADGERSGTVDGRGGSGGRDGVTSTMVEGVSLERLVTERMERTKCSAVSARLGILLRAEVVCATLSGSGSHILVETVMMSMQLAATKLSKTKKGQKKAKAAGREGQTILGFDAVVMDEAAQAVEPSSMIPLKYNPRAVIMVGDPAQLPATIFSKDAQRANYAQSLFLRLQRGGHPKTMLDTQYRMHPDIASFASTRFYSGLLRSAPTVTEASHGQVFHRLPRFAPYLFHNVSSGRLKRGGEGYGGAKSLSNPTEVSYITSLLQDLITTFPGTDFNGRIGVIAPYRNQIRALQRGMWSTGLRHDGVEVSTVDGFQGREKDIMIFSCVRAPELQRSGDSGSSSGGGIGFLDDWRRLNVAITRAKFAMWIVGHAGVLKQSTDWRELINDSKKRNAFIDSSSPDASSSGRNSGSTTSRGSNGGGSRTETTSTRAPEKEAPSAASSTRSRSPVVVGTDQGRERGHGLRENGQVGETKHDSRQNGAAGVALARGEGSASAAMPSLHTTPLAAPPPLPSHIWASGNYYNRQSASPQPPTGLRAGGTGSGRSDAAVRAQPSLTDSAGSQPHRLDDTRTVVVSRQGNYYNRQPAPPQPPAGLTGSGRRDAVVRAQPSFNDSADSQPNGLDRRTVVVSRQGNYYNRQPAPPQPPAGRRGGGAGSARGDTTVQAQPSFKDSAHSQPNGLDRRTDASRQGNYYTREPAPSQPRAGRRGGGAGSARGDTTVQAQPSFKDSGHSQPNGRDDKTVDASRQTDYVNRLLNGSLSTPRSGLKTPDNI